MNKLFKIEKGSPPSADNGDAYQENGIEMPWAKMKIGTKVWLSKATVVKVWPKMLDKSQAEVAVYVRRRIERWKRTENQLSAQFAVRKGGKDPGVTVYRVRKSRVKKAASEVQDAKRETTEASAEV